MDPADRLSDAATKLYFTSAGIVLSSFVLALFLT